MFGSNSVFDSAAYQPLASGPETSVTEPARRKNQRALRYGRGSAPGRARDVLASESMATGSRKRQRVVAFHGDCDGDGLEIGRSSRFDAGVAPGGCEIACPAPTPPTDSMWQSLLGCLSAFKDPSYATSLGCMLASAVGTGLIESGYLMTLKGVGQEPLLANEIMQALQEFGTVPAMFVAYYLIDRAAASREPHPDIPQRYMRGLAACGAVDLALGAGLATGAWAHSRGLLGSHGLLALVAAGQTIASVKSLLNFGYWRCVKLNIGSEATQRKQRELQMQMTAVEVPFFLLISYSQSIGVYAAAIKYASHQIMRVGALALAVGGVFACLPKTYFLGKAWQITRQRRAVAVASPC